MNKKNFLLTGLLLFCGAISAAPVDIAPAESVGMSAKRLANVKDRLQRVIDEERTGGIQVLIARKGKVVMHENLGYANVEEKVPITDDTLFRIYSMTKPVVGAAMLMLYAVYSETDFAPYPVSQGEYFWSGIASTLFWIDPEEDLVVVKLTQYLPFASPVYRDLMHRLVHAAIID